jgi:hypothetical protein
VIVGLTALALVTAVASMGSMGGYRRKPLGTF